MRKRPVDEMITSEAETGKVTPQSFKNVIHGSAVTYKDHVLIKYTDDGFLYHATPEELVKYISPRNTYQTDYEGRDRLEKGMRIRCEWDAERRYCKAEVLESNPDGDKIRALYKELKVKEASPSASVRSRRSKKSKIIEKAESERIKRADINNRLLLGMESPVASVESSNSDQMKATSATDDNIRHQDTPAIRSSDPDRHEHLSERISSENTSVSDDMVLTEVQQEGEAITSTQDPVLLAAETQDFPDTGSTQRTSTVEETQPNNHESSGGSFADDGAEAGTAEIPADITPAEIEKVDEERVTLVNRLVKLDTYRRKADDILTNKPPSQRDMEKLRRYDRKVKEIEELLGYHTKVKSFMSGLNRTKGTKIAFIKPEWTFMNAPEEEDLPFYCDIGGKGLLWVRKVAMNRLRKVATSLKDYGNKLLWNLMFTDADFVFARQNKKTSVGFAKLFGSEKIQVLYDHLDRFRARKVAEHGPLSKWARPMLSIAVLKRKWCKAFNDRMTIYDGVSSQA